MTATDAGPAGPEQTAGVVAYAAAVASREPTPGGGSVVGVVGALAAALGAMVCRFTIPAAGDAASDGTGSTELDLVLAELDRARGEMFALAEADAAAYNAYRVAVSLPKATDDERRERRQAMQAALAQATEVPLAVGRGCARLEALLLTVAAAGNPHVRSDAEIGLLLARAALRGTLINVRGNIGLLKDETLVARYRADLADLERIATGTDAAG